MQDHLDFITAQWAEAMPDVDVGSMAVFGRLVRLQKQLERLRADALAQYGFKDGEFDVLATLRRAGAPYQLSPTELYRALLVTSGAMTNRVARLESAGLIERIADAQDKRSSRVALSERGKVLIEQAVVTHTQIQDAVLAPLDAAERDALALLLKRLLVPLPGEVLDPDSTPEDLPS